MLTGQMPYPPPEDGNPSSVLREIRTTQLTFPPELSPTVVDLLKRMLEPEVKDRIKLFEVRNHPWVVEHRSPSLGQNSSYESLPSISLPSISSSPSLCSMDDLVSPRDDIEKCDKDSEKDKDSNKELDSCSPPAPLSAPTSPVFSRLMAPSVSCVPCSLDSAHLTQGDV